jgi:hypothetical protein
MAENFNASVVCLIRYPNGTQHTKYVLASGGGIQFAQSEDGILIDKLWVRHWNKKQGCFFASVFKLEIVFKLKLCFSEKRQKLCEEKGIWQDPDRNFCPKAGPKPCGWCGGHRGISKMSH